MLTVAKLEARRAVLKTVAKKSVETEEWPGRGQRWLGNEKVVDLKDI